MQDIVYKLVPGLYKSEQERREKFYEEMGETDPSKYKITAGHFPTNLSKWPIEHSFGSSFCLIKQ